MSDAPVIKRNEKGQWLPGQAGGNMGGRPKGYKGFAKEIMKRTNNGADLLDFIKSVLDGTCDGGSTLAAKMWATEQLLNRGLGKAPQVIEINNNIDHDAAIHAIDYDKLREDELEVLEKAADIMGRHTSKRTPIDV